MYSPFGSKKFPF